MIFAISIFSGAFAALAVARFKWALLVLIGLLPAYLIRFNLGWLPTTLLEVMIWIVAAAFLFRRRKELKKILSTKDQFLQIGILLLLISATVSLLIAPDLRAAAGLWKAYVIEPIALFFIFITTFSKKDTHAIVSTLSLTALVVSIVAIYQKFTGAWIPNPFWAAEQTRRVTSVWGFPNAIGLFLAPLIPLFAQQLWRNKHKWFGRIYWGAVIAANLLAIVWAKTTGALVALAGALLIVGLLYKKTRLLTAGFGVAAALSIILVPAFSSIKTELLFADYSGGLRIDMWAEAAELISDHPVLGTGLSSYKESIYRYRIDKWIEVFEYPHNMMLNFWIELGMAGLISFVILFYWAIKKSSNYALLGSIVVILIHGLVDVPYFKNDLAVLFWLVLALIFISKEKNDNLSKEVT